MSWVQRRFKHWPSRSPRSPATDGVPGSKALVFGVDEMELLCKESRTEGKDEAYLVECIADALAGYDVLSIVARSDHVSLLHKALASRRDWPRLCEICFVAGGARALAERWPTGLTSLDLRWNGLKAESARALAERLPAGLTSLNLEENDLGVEGARALAERLPSGLASLVLGWNGLGAKGARVLAERLPGGVKSLDLRGNGLGDEGAWALAEWLPTGLRLTSLNLAKNQIGAKGGRALAERLPVGLTSLVLGGNDLGAEGARVLAEWLPAGLTSLDLRGNGLGVEGARALAKGGLPEGLTSLNLAMNEIGAKGVRALAKWLPVGLTSLDLADNGLGCEGVCALAERLPVGLRSLDLSRNGVEAKGALALAERLPAGLTSLYLAENSFGAEGARALAEQLPEGLTSLDLGLSDSEEEAVLEWLGSEQEPLPVDDVLLLVFSDVGHRGRAQVRLEANRKQVENLRLLQEIFPGRWPAARDVRILLCGNPEVGKTCLRRSFTGQVQRDDGRTEGMEVEYVDEGALRITLWDLGGQEEFHLLHSYLMPESTSAGNTTVFVLLLKLKFEDGGHFNKTLEESIDALWYWCRLIVSTSAPGRTRRLVVVFNHWEGSQQALFDSALLVLRDKVKELSKEFEGKIEFWGPHTVNARAGREDHAVKCLYNELMRQIGELVKGVQVPQLCQDIIGKLKVWREICWRKENMPVMGGSEFLGEVQKLIEDYGIRQWFFENEVKAVMVLLDYLQDTGQIVYFKGPSDSSSGQILGEDRFQAKWVVLEMGWLGHDMAGGLLGLRVRRSQTQGAECEVRVNGGEIIAAHLQDFYERRNYKWVMVLQLLKELNICYEVPRKTVREIQKLFVPSLLPKEATGEAFKQWNLQSCMDVHDVGCCLSHSEKSIFGLCFFERLQTILAATLKPELLPGRGGVDLVNECKISFFRKTRVLILLRYDEQRDEIYVLARPKFKDCSSEEVLAEHAAVTQVLMHMAATERNGVEVIKDILQPVCLTGSIDSEGYLGTLPSRMRYSREELHNLVAQVESTGRVFPSFRVQQPMAHVACSGGQHLIPVYDIVQKAEFPVVLGTGAEDSSGPDSKNVLQLLKSMKRVVSSVDQKMNKMLLHSKEKLPVRFCLIMDVGKGRNPFKKSAMLYYECEGTGEEDSHFIMDDVQGGLKGMKVSLKTPLGGKVHTILKYGLMAVQGGLILGAILSPLSAIVAPAIAVSAASAITQQAAQYFRPERWVKATVTEELLQRSNPLALSHLEPFASADDGGVLDDPKGLQYSAAIVLEAVFQRQGLYNTGLYLSEMQKLQKECGLYPVKLARQSGIFNPGDIKWVCDRCQQHLQPL